MKTGHIGIGKLKALKVNCCICGKLVKPGNAIHNERGYFYYCKKKECQKRFIEDAGERPESDYD